MNNSSKAWLGKTECDFCHNDIAETSSDLVDGKTIYGPWAVMCNGCFTKYGSGIGPGVGQRYKRADNRDAVEYHKVMG